MTARKALELAAIILLPGVLLYAACAFVSLEWDFREWSEWLRFYFMTFWAAASAPIFWRLKALRA